MQFTFETNYDRKGLAVMAKCLRKTVRKAKSKRSHILGWVVVVLAALLSWPFGEGGFTVDFRKVLTWLVMAVMVAALLFEDRLNGYFAGKRMLKGTEKAASVFDTEAVGFVSETAVGKSEFSYDTVQLVAETAEYFVFVFSASHAQIYDKSSLTGGTAAEFRQFIADRTGKPVVTLDK